jgi:hypothetical protein
MISSQRWGTVALFCGWSLLSMLFTSGCSSRLASSDTAGGGRDASNDTACTAPSAPASPPAGDAGASSAETVEAQWLAALDGLIGQYLRGDVIVYRGTIQGSAKTEALPGSDPIPETTIPEGAALASLIFRSPSVSFWAPIAPAAFVNGNQALLTVRSLADDQYMVFGQPESDPTMTATSGIQAGATQNVLMATCSDCASSFWARPAAITFDLAAAGTVTTVYYGFDGTSSADQAVSTAASVQLSAFPPCNLTFGDLTTLNEAPGINQGSSVFLTSFVLTGGEWVFHTTSNVITKDPSAHGACDGQSFQYTIDLYVNAANLGDYGVRNYVPGPTQAICAA